MTDRERKAHGMCSHAEWLRRATGCDLVPLRNVTIPCPDWNRLTEELRAAIARALATGKVDKD